MLLGNATAWQRWHEKRRVAGLGAMLLGEMRYEKKLEISTKNKEKVEIIIVIVHFEKLKISIDKWTETRDVTKQARESPDCNRQGEKV